MNETLTLLKKTYPFLLATIVNLAVYCYQNYSSRLNQIIKNLTIYVGIVGLLFVNLKFSRITCNQSMCYLFWINNLHHSAIPLAQSHRQAILITFPASIEVHESAMKNTLMTFIIPNQNIEHNLIEFMTLKKNDIQSLILDRTCNGPCKVQFLAKLTLIKQATVVSDQSVQQPEDESVEIFANSMMAPIYANGLSDDSFFEMLGKMETVFQNFSAHGSGWVLQRVNELYIKIGKVLPIRGSSFIPLPAKIAKSHQLINHNNHNCFLLCYTAAYHLRYKPDLIVRRLVDPKLEETDPHTYTKPGTHQASDDFVMPISFNIIPQFERPKDVKTFN